MNRSEASLSILILADVQCAWCKKITGKKFINADNWVSQTQLKNEGRLVSHGICKACSDDLFNNEYRIEETAREIKSVMDIVEAVYEKQAGYKTLPHERRFQEMYI